MHSGSTPCCFTPFRIISNRLFNYFNTLLSVSPLNHSVDRLGMFRLSKYGVHTYIHLQACLLWPSDAPPCLYPCDYSSFFYFHFIYSILYILHTLIFRNTSSHFASQYRIAQRYYLSSLEPSTLRKYHASPRIELLGLALVCIHVVQIRFIHIHLIYLYTYSSSLLIHSMDFGRVDLTPAHFRSSVLWCLFGLIQTL